MAAPADGCGRPRAHGGRAQAALALTTCAASSWQAAQSGLHITLATASWYKAFWLLLTAQPFVYSCGAAQRR